MAVQCHVVHPDHHRTPSGFRDLLIDILESMGGSGDHVTVVLCRDSLIRRLNREFLNRNESTDVISFDLRGDEAKKGNSRFRGFDSSNTTGEIYVNLDRARTQARQCGITFWEELTRLSIHGLLHLFDFDDRNPADQRKMTAKQEELLQKFWRPLHW